jgi:hypothetical protein
MRRIDASDRAFLDPGSSARPTAEVIEQVIEVGFWASLLPEEGHNPRVTLAYTEPPTDGTALTFEHQLPFEPHVVAHMAASVERPGVHLGLWHIDGALRIWGILRSLPYWCFVLEVAAPGLLVVKYRRPDQVGKLANLAVLEGSSVKMIEPQSAVISDAPHAMLPLLAFYSSAGGTASDDVLVRTAISMREHRRGGTLLIVPHKDNAWLGSLALPMPYRATPPYSEVDELLQVRKQEGAAATAGLMSAVNALAGLTAVDGATVISDRYAVLAYGAKIRRADNARSVERVLVTEPIEGTEPVELDASQLGGTRHLSAAQFVQDQPDSIAMVASQDGRFTVFVWSRAIGVVHGHRLDSLLL